MMSRGESRRNQEEWRGEERPLRAAAARAREVAAAVAAAEQPARKRRRGSPVVMPAFNDTDLPRMQQQRRLQGREPGGLVNRELDPQQFSGPSWDCWSATQVGGGQYKSFRVVATMQLKDPWREDGWPDEELREMVSTLWHWVAKQAHEQMGLRANMFLVAAEGGHLNSAVVRPFREMGEAMEQTFVNAFRAADQSGQARGHPSVVEGLFRLDITAVEVTGRRKLPKKAKKNDER